MRLNLPRFAVPDRWSFKVACCGICGTDVHEYTKGPIFMPKQQILGHEFSGTVAEVGSKLKTYREGDRVAIQPLLGDTSRKGNLRTLRSSEDRFGSTQGSESAFSNSFVGVPDVIAG
jgi:threonine dehydrogenase-like Zn-dependent dehydrogenase